MNNIDNINTVATKIATKRDDLISISEKLNSSLLSNSTSTITYLKSELIIAINDINELLTLINSATENLIDE